MPGKENRPVGEEHIIPRSFGGNLILKEASCLKCATITSRFETKCLNGMVATARYHMGIDSRGRKNRSKAPVQFITDDGKQRTVAVPLEDHPAVLILPVMPMPGAALGLDFRHSQPVAISVAIIPVISDFTRRAAAFGDRTINLTRGLDALSSYRLIAKISHAFLCAEIGIDGFIPQVQHIVKTHTALFADHFIGSINGSSAAQGNTLHEISLAPSIFQDEWELLVVQLRLFAHLPGTPTYLSVAGRRTRS